MNCEEITNAADIDVIDWERAEVASRSYAWVGWYLGGMMRQRLGEAMPESAQQAMSDLMVVGCHVDAAIDTKEYEVSNEQVVEDVTGYLLGHPDSEQPPYLSRCRKVQDLRGYLETHDDSGRLELAAGFGKIVGTTTVLQQPLTPWQYSQLTRHEGQQMMSLMASLLPESVRQDPRSRPVLRWMHHFVQLANVVDSYVDARRDIADGLIAQPRLGRIRTALAANALRDAVPAVAGMRRQEIAKLARTIKIKW